MMLSSSTGGDAGAALSSGMTGLFLIISCLNGEEWAAAHSALGSEREERESLQCVMAELGGPEDLVAAMQAMDGDQPSEAFLAAALKCGTPMGASPGG
jgi:hypothetical protein